ncbi:melanoma antigen preferentially expressed in tumors-like [Myotis daubentonii]|uniref:melanoma antigen preferentially expressed in tumors-like n=1 Tax=Myotis daubentonii TaxID=98922 RepID=UPI002872D368|nr:melanoma antigen preferentially expressed in tumors-like [Myotis daubentonii]
MSIRTPPTLLELAAKRLLRDQASAIAALEYLPAELFPYLFAMAYCGGGHPQLLKALAQAWPFTVLPLGVLMQRPPDHAPTRAADLKAVFEALDVLLFQKVRPRRCKLRVLDLRNTGANFWYMWLGVSTENCSPTGPVAVHSSSPNMEHPLAPLEVFLDLTFSERDQDKIFMRIIQWAQQREGLLHLCCKALRISGVPFQRVRGVLDGVRLDCIQEVYVNCTWDLPTLGTFALYLGQMSNLQTLYLPRIDVLAEEEEDEDEPLGALLEAVAPTLQTLGLDNCGMADSQVEAILPALSRCHQLTGFSICMNNFPVATVEKLLRHTAGLRSLEVEVYPIPLECYNTQGTVNQERLALIHAELTGILRELGQPRTIYLTTKHLRQREFYKVAFSWSP